MERIYADNAGTTPMAAEVIETMTEMMKNDDPEKLAKVTAAFLKMKKFDIEELTKAWKS